MSIQLAYSTQDPQVDTILQGITGLLEIIFPGRVRAYYLTGSLVNSTAVYGSDVDVIIVFKEELKNGEEECCRQTGLNATLLTGRRIDLAARSEAELVRTGATGIKLATRLLYGEDIRERIPLEPMEQFRHHVIRGFVFYSRELRGTPDQLTYPLAYPQADDPFFGYTRRGIWHGNRRHEPGTRLLLNAVTLGATLKVLLAAGVRCSAKAEAVQQYRQQVADEWADWLVELFEQCKFQWHYQVPDDPAGRAHLGWLLECTPDFENDVLRRCHPYVDVDIPVIYQESVV